ncbi:hypothetical protein FRC17_010110 [Serendipita sp. 399]|nr:hypothetical protein FRC17_010110 [Serendipita sp. 399]
MATTIPFQNAKFTLDISGVAGFFGGDEVISAMGSVHFYRGRKYLGWYNSPGSYTVAKKYGRLANSRFWNGLFPGGNTDPNGFLGLDGEKGPAFIATHSGTKMSDTGHVAQLLLGECKGLKEDGEEWKVAAVKEVQKDNEAAPSSEKNGNEDPKSTCFVSVANLPPCPPNSPNLQRPWKTWTAGLPILTSVGPAAACAYFRDWYCFSMIVLGMISSGVACLVVGLGTLKFVHPKPAKGSPPGDGVLHAGSDFVVLRGEEASVNAITRGSFSLKLSGAPQNHAIGFSALLLVVQFFVQLLLIPQGTLFGQVMFLVTFACSWVYNCYLSSIDKQELQTSILMKNVLGIEKSTLKSTLKKYLFTKRTTAVVFLLLVLQPPEKAMLLNELLPNDTEVWRKWKKEVLDQLGGKGQKRFVFPSANDNAAPLAPNDAALLENLYEYTHNAYTMYLDYEQSSDESSIYSREAKMDPANAERV